MMEELLGRAGVRRTDLLDLATGPGRIALALAPRFTRVVGIDIEADMIEVARREATRRGITNVTFELGAAEELQFPPESVDLVTIGEAFHRLPQRLVAGKVFEWLRPGGCLVTLGSDGRFSGDEPWEATLRDVRERWLRTAFPDGWARYLPGESEDQERREAVMRGAGFVGVQGHDDFETVLTQSFEDVLGYLESTSVCTRRVLGADFDRFAEELRGALTAGGTHAFREAISWGYTLARKPA
jgi:SAM-dependent methyltransferase